MRALPTLLAALALGATAACSPNTSTSAPADTRPDGDPPGTTIDGGTTTDPDSGAATGGVGRFPRVLTPFSDCSAYLDHVKAVASERVGPYGLQTDPWYHWFGEDVAVDDMEMAEESAAGDGDRANASVADEGASGGDDSGGGGFTTTNVQEVGIDEPDLVKTDGERILVVAENRLSYVDVTGDPYVTDTLTLPEGWGHELFISGDRALLFTNGGEWGVPVPVGADVDADDAEASFAESDIAVPIEHFTPAALILEVDLSDPGALAVSASMRIEGQYLSARAIGERVRLAVTSAPSQLPWLFPQNENGEDRAEQANREIIAESTIDDWLPSYRLDAGNGTTEGTLLSCDRAHRPAEFAGFDMISIVDLDLGQGLGGAADGLDAVGVLAGGQTVYSSADRMYVATTKWVGADSVADESVLREWNEDYETDIHAFAISTDEPTDYVASGTIEGSLLNQFSMDEHEGFLRVITTDGSPWGAEATSETHLVVYEEQGDRLVPVGEVGGLGKGEQLFSARLMGDVGFAVTFRQIDPFYVLDLSDPRNPRVTGELKIPGVSTYLHPVSEGFVLGVGQNATEEGMVLGLKLSLFDVTDPADPREVAVWTLDDANSPVEWDHRAFQMWGSTAIVPVQQWNGDFNGAVLFDISDTITEIGRVSHVRPEDEPTSDCRKVTADQLAPDESELWYMVSDGYGHVQVCEPGATGGWGTWFCERIPADEIRFWFWDEATADDELARMGVDGDETIEMCWPDDDYGQQIQRSLVIGDTLWTTTPAAIQANALDGLGLITQLSLR